MKRKNTLTLLFMVLIAFTLSACGKDTLPTEKAEIIDAIKPTETLPNETSFDDQNTDGSVAVDEGLFNVTITLPASYFEDLTDFDPEVYTKEQGFKKTIVNDDGSISITMSKSKHDELMAVMKETLDESFAQLIEAENTLYIKAITSDDEYKTVIVDVNKEGYESAFDLTPLLIGISAMMYQQYNGTSELHCEVIIRDIETGDTLNSVIYPDALN